jgi:peptidoglycan/LPS O-acetylase OafA/YrhL
MNEKKSLALILILSVVVGAISGYLKAHHLHEPLWWSVGSTFLFMVLIFAWYYQDSTNRSYQRTALLNIGVVALALVAIPYYIIRSREKGQKGRALLRLAGFILLMFLSSVIGALAVYFVG